MTNQHEKMDIEPEKEFKIKFGDLIRAYREKIGLNRHAASTLLKVSNSTLQAWESGERTPNAYNLTSLSSLYKVNISHFFKQNELDQTPPNEDGIIDTLGYPVDLDEFYFVPRYNIKASAGHGAAIGNEAPMHQMAFRKYWVDIILQVAVKGLAVIGVKGDSMFPVINDKDVLLININDTSLRDGIYVIRLNDDLIVKRIQVMIGGIINVISSNPAYNPFELNLNNLPSDFAIIGRVVWFGRTVP